MSKFSANHAAAVAYIDQAGGVLQFTNERAQDPGVQALRKIVTVTPSKDLRLDQAVASVTTKSGQRFEAKIEHATGTVANPMSDKDLEAKFMGNAVNAIGDVRSKQVVELVWGLEQLKDVALLCRRCA
jgi:2-methylcitrate dehydratase PrpD